MLPHSHLAIRRFEKAALRAVFVYQVQLHTLGVVMAVW